MATTSITIQKPTYTSTAQLEESDFGVQLRSYPRPPATVVAIGGEIDACNAEHVNDYLAGFIHLDHPLVLDLSGVDFLGVAGYRAIVGFGAQRRSAQRALALVTSDAVNVLLRVLPDYWLPAVESMDEALQGLRTCRTHHRGLRRSQLPR